jgi:predicted Fe-Mo cluster-binding NifX family protein
MKRIAIPIVNNKLSEFFGECERYEIYDIDQEIKTKSLKEIPASIAIEDLPEWLEKQGVSDVIAYKVNPKIINLFASRKVNLYVGIPSDSPQKLIDEYLQGKLESDEKIIDELTNRIE